MYMARDRYEMVDKERECDNADDGGGICFRFISLCI